MAGKTTNSNADEAVGTWKQAWFSSPGPTSFKETAWLALKGLSMGSADVIPGVSGGTLALITGIYQDLLAAIQSFDAVTFKSMFALQLKQALARVHIRFLLALFCGIGAAIVSLARLMNFLLHQHPIPTWSLFFGLIAASILVVGRQLADWFGRAGICFAAGTIAAYFIVNLIPMTTPEDLWFILLCGIVAICAMILPGISGAFILLILGKYEYITATLKNPFLPQNLAVIIVFGLGCVIGLAGFSRVLNYLLDRYHNLTLAFLTGLMTGSMQKIWPWKEILQVQLVGGKPHVIWGGNILPAQMDSQVWLALLLAVVGFSGVMILERLARKRI